MYQFVVSSTNNRTVRVSNSRRSACVCHVFVTLICAKKLYASHIHENGPQRVKGMSYFLKLLE